MLAIGIVVDDAIVVVEAVEHHIEHGLSPRDATIRAMEQVSGPVIAVGLVLSAVFVPCAFIRGITGQFFRQFALTIAVSTIISAFNSLTLSPALTALLAAAAATRRRPPPLAAAGVRPGRRLAGLDVLGWRLPGSTGCACRRLAGGHGCRRPSPASAGGRAVDGQVVGGDSCAAVGWLSAGLLNRAAAGVLPRVQRRLLA